MEKVNITPEFVGSLSVREKALFYLLTIGNLILLLLIPVFAIFIIKYCTDSKYALYNTIAIVTFVCLLIIPFKLIKLKNKFVRKKQNEQSENTI